MSTFKNIIFKYLDSTRYYNYNKNIFLNSLCIGISVAYIIENDKMIQLPCAILLPVPYTSYNIYKHRYDIKNFLITK
jgi:hypothetical protein